MRTLIVSLTVILAGHGPLMSEAQSDSVAKWIDQLASPVDSPHANGYDPTPTSLSDGIHLGYKHKQVRKAQAILTAMGPKIFPELVDNLSDDRYSYSHVSARWGNYSVGHLINRILADGIEFYGWGYRSRRNPNGTNSMPRFEDYLKEIGVVEWAEQAALLTKDDLRKQFIEWYVAKEKELGFIDNEQRNKFIGPCLIEIERLSNTAANKTE